MLTEIYIEALLVNPEMADEVWITLVNGDIDDPVAAWAWWLISKNRLDVGLQLGLGGCDSEAE